MRIFGRKNRRLFGREKDYGFSDGKRNRNFTDGKETAVLQTEKEAELYGRERDGNFRTEKETELCGRERDGNFRTEKETVALRTTEETAVLPVFGENMPALSQIRLIVFIQ